MSVQSINAAQALGYAMSSLEQLPEMQALYNTIRMSVQQGNVSIVYTSVATATITKVLQYRGFTVTPDGTTPAILTITFPLV